MKKQKLLAGAACLALVFAFFLSTCEMEVAKTPPVIPELEITSELEGGVFNLGAAIPQLVLDVASPPEGTLSFQWYSFPARTLLTEDDGVSANTLDPVINAAGVYNYYVVVTLTTASGSNSVTSNIVTIIVNDPSSPVKYPVIIQHPPSGIFIAGEVDLVIEVEDAAPGVTTTYQWYRGEVAGGTAVSGATASSSKVTLSDSGDFKFYCVVTNSAGGQSLSVNSLPATITIIAGIKENATVTINSSSKRQYVRGFGGMDIPWGNFFEISMEEYEKMYNPKTGLGFNMIRIMIQPGIPIQDSGGLVEEDSDGDIEKTMDYYVNGGGNRPFYYEGVKLVNKYGGYVLASPWSPPMKWKTNNTTYGGGSLRKSNWHDYAGYLRDFAQHMSDKGAPIYAISIQNEPNFKASYEGCEWTDNEMRDFFVQEGHFTTIPTSIAGYGGGKATDFVLTMNGESANHPNINDRAMDNEDSRAAIDVLGRHTYGNAQNRYAKALDVEPKKEVWMTEHNINSGNSSAYVNDSTWNYVWVFLNDVDLSIRLNDESAFIWWALKRFYSFIGEGQYGTVEGAILPRGYAMSHYAKYASEMWRVPVGTSGTTANGLALTTSNVNGLTLNRNGTDVKITAFISEDGNTISLVMFTPTDFAGKNGVDMGTIKIQLPRNWIAKSAKAMRSSAKVKAKAEAVTLSTDKNSAFVTLPPGNILSVMFTKN